MTIDTVLSDLYNVIVTRRDADPATSYTARLFVEGTARIAQKVGEEGLEVALAAVQRDKPATISEVADLLFHTLVLCVDQGITLNEIRDELVRRQT